MVYFKDEAEIRILTVVWPEYRWPWRKEEFFSDFDAADQHVSSKSQHIDAFDFLKQQKQKWRILSPLKIMRLGSCCIVA